MTRSISSTAAIFSSVVVAARRRASARWYSGVRLAGICYGHFRTQESVQEVQKVQEVQEVRVAQRAAGLNFASEDGLITDEDELSTLRPPQR